MDIREQLKLLSNGIVKKFTAKKIILFGSYAYGNPEKDSDIDLCIIVELKNRRKLEVIRDIRRELIAIISYPLDILVYNEKEFHERSEMKNTLEYKIMHEGIQIYG